MFNKKLIIGLLCVNAILTTMMIYLWFVTPPTQVIVQQPEEERLSVTNQDMLLTLLDSHINTAIKGHYKTNQPMGILTDPTIMEIVEMKRLEKDRGMNFSLTIKVKPVSGTRQQVGEDKITFQIAPGILNILDYEHLQDFVVPDYTQ